MAYEAIDVQCIISIGLGNTKIAPLEVFKNSLFYHILKIF